MRTVFQSPIQYYLPVGNTELHVNSYIGKRIDIEFLDSINCISCGVKTKTSFHQGYCYSCYISVPQTDEGVLNPEKDKSHLGISRDMEWAKQNSLIDHFVYLSLTSDIKVGVTRHTQIPQRWIDQGAIKAIKLARTPYRQLAGEIEVFLKNHLSDKTNWSKMLSAENTSIDLVERKIHFCSLLPKEFKKFISLDNTVFSMIYPYKNITLDKFSTVNLDKEKKTSSVLQGIKGQYLIFENGKVINIRKHNGYKINLNILD